MPPRCIWTGQRSDRAVPVTLDVPSRTAGAASPRTVHVLPEHEDDLRAYNASVTRWGRPMLVGLLALTVALVGLAVAGAVLGVSEADTAVGAGALVGAMGLVIVAFPFATPETVGAVGIRASVRIARVLGLVAVALGVWIAVAA